MHWGWLIIVLLFGMFLAGFVGTPQSWIGMA
jgi:hypothetical protein